MKGEMHLPELIRSDEFPKPDHMLHVHDIDISHAKTVDDSSFVLIVFEADEGSYGVKMAASDFRNFADMVDTIRRSVG